MALSCALLAGVLATSLSYSTNLSHVYIISHYQCIPSRAAASCKREKAGA